MSNKREELLEYLIDHPGTHTAKELAVAIDRSPRSVKTYIHQLQSEYQIVADNRGYHLLDNAKIEKDIPKHAQHQLINKLLSSTQSFNLYDLAEEFYLSESSVINIINGAKEQLKNYNLEIVHKSDMLSIQGKESDRRHYISAEIYQEISGDFLNETIIKQNFKNIDIDAIVDAINNAAVEESIYLNTFDKNNIVLHIAIALERQSGGHIVEKMSDHPQRDSSFADTILTNLRKSGIVFQPSEQADLRVIINSSISRSPNDDVDLISPETQDLLDEIVEYMRQVYSLDMRSMKFYKQFGVHLDRLICRLKKGQRIHNPLAISIKQSSPTVYECAVLIGHLISDRCQVEVPDNEIGFIAMHIGNALSEQMMAENMVKTVVFAPVYHDQISTIVNQIDKHFADSLLIIGVCSDPEQVSSFSPDLVICVGGKTSYPVHQIEISPFINYKDINLIQRSLTNIRHQKTQDEITEKFETFFNEELFYYGKDVTSREKALQKIVTGFVKANAVDQNYLTKLQQREQLSSTAFGKVAIPHSFNMIAKKSRGFILVNPVGINWDKQGKVYVVIGLAIDSENTKLFREVFDRISDVMVDDSNISQLIQCHSYKEFMAKLLSLL